LASRPSQRESPRLAAKHLAAAPRTRKTGMNAALNDAALKLGKRAGDFPS